MLPVNMFTIRSAVDDGIELRVSESGPELPLGTPENEVLVELGYNNSRLPHWHRSLLIKGKAVVSHPARIEARGDWPGIIVRIRTQDLFLPSEPLVRHINFHPGGEGKRPLFNLKSHQDTSIRDELYALAPRESLLIVDHNKVIMRLVFNGTQRPTLEEVIKEDLIEHVWRRSTIARSTGALTWCIRTLESLSVPQSHLLDLYEQRRQLSP